MPITRAYAQAAEPGNFFVAGKNKIINGDFFINQRGFSSTTSSGYHFDRWQGAHGSSGVTYSSQTFTLGTAPVAGYEGKTFYRTVTTGQVNAGDYAINRQFIEGVRTFANQTVTVSFWAKAASGTPSVAVDMYQIFGTGGSPSSSVDFGGSKQTLSTSWARYSFTINVPSISGKTIGTNNDDYLALRIWWSAGSTYNTQTNSLGNQNNTFDIWGVQVEAGAVATPFTTATGTLAGELAAAQRYYWRFTSNGTSASVIGQIGIAYNTTDISAVFKCPVTMRTTPTSLDYANVAVLDVAASRSNITSVTILDSSPDNVRATLVGSGFTAQRSYLIYNQSGTTGYIGYSAEL